MGIRDKLLLTLYDCSRRGESLNASEVGIDAEALSSIARALQDEGYIRGAVFVNVDQQNWDVALLNNASVTDKGKRHVMALW